jgi:hypothetical protein
MGITKKLDWSNIFIFLFLVIFPFGQIFHLTFNLLGVGIAPQPLDIVVGCAAIYAILSRMEKPKIFRYLTNFLLITLFSFIFSIFIFKTPTVIYGFLYFVRLVAYVYFFVYVYNFVHVWNFVNIKPQNKKLLLDCLLGVSLISVVFGWIQFFAVPSIKPLFIFGWDMHTFRLVGTFLDPAFLGLIIVFGLLISLVRLIETKKKIYIPMIIFLLISLAFTYSRASYLAFLAGAIALGILKKKIKYILYLGIALIILIMVLPTSRNHSIEFFRSFSVIDRINNYKETLQIIKKFPVFGIGFDNLCLARNRYIGIESYLSHSCSGSDSSLLFILATTGVAGFIIFHFMIYQVFKAIPPRRWKWNTILISCAIALFIDSLFSNSLFYPWIMGYMIILLAVSIKE